MHTSVSSFRRLWLAQMTFSMTLSPQCDQDRKRREQGEECLQCWRSRYAAGLCHQHRTGTVVAMCRESAELCSLCASHGSNWSSLNARGQSPEGQLISQSSYLRPNSWRLTGSRVWKADGSQAVPTEGPIEAGAKMPPSRKQTEKRWRKAPRERIPALRFASML